MHGWLSESGAVAALTCFIISAVTAEHDVDLLIITVVFALVVGFLWLIVRSTLSRQAEGSGLERLRSVLSGGPSRTASVQIEGLPAPSAVEQLISTRRSVFPRDFNGAPVSEDKIERLLEAANWAPTHGVTEPWRFVIASGAAKAEFEELTIKLCQARLPEGKVEKVVEKLKNKQKKDWKNVSHYIIVGMKRQANPDKMMPEWEEMCATACAVQNMLLLMTAMGLAGYWTSWQEAARDSPEMKEWLGLEEADRCMGVIVLGYSDRLDSYRGTRKPMDQKVTWKGRRVTEQ